MHFGSPRGGRMPLAASVGLRVPVGRQAFPPNPFQKSEFGSLWRPPGPRWRLPWPAQMPKADFLPSLLCILAHPRGRRMPLRAVGSRWRLWDRSRFPSNPPSPPFPPRNLNSTASGGHLGLAGGCLGQSRRQKLIFTTHPMHFGPSKGEEDAVGGYWGRWDRRRFTP